MPILDLGSFDTVEDCYVAGHRIHAVMTWPDPAAEDSRREFLVAVAADSLARGGGEAFERLFSECGGLAAVCEARPLKILILEVRAAYKSWVAAHLVMRAMIQIPSIEGASSRDISLRKASEMAVASRGYWTSEFDRVVVRKDAKWVKDQFRERRAVAHLCLPYISIHQRARYEKCEDAFTNMLYGGADELLGQALAAELWLEETRVEREPTEILTLTDIWSLRAIPNISPRPIEMQKLRQEEIEAFHAYAAPPAPA